MAACPPRAYAVTPRKSPRGHSDELTVGLAVAPPRTLHGAVRRATVDGAFA
jgi:hypothetical protein